MKIRHPQKILDKIIQLLEKNYIQENTRNKVILYIINQNNEK